MWIVEPLAKLMSIIVVGRDRHRGCRERMRSDLGILCCTCLNTLSYVKLKSWERDINWTL